MSKASQFARVNYEMYGPQKGYGDPNRSAQTLAHGIDSVMQSRKYRYMKLKGKVEENHLELTDEVTGSSVSTTVTYEKSERQVQVRLYKKVKETIEVTFKVYEFGHYMGGALAHTLLTLLRGEVHKEEPDTTGPRFSVSEASKVLGISEREVRALQTDDYGPPWYKDGTRIYFPQEQLAQWKETHKEPK